MNPEDIKVGETYNVRVKVKVKGEDYITVTPILQGGVLSTYWPTSFTLGESAAFSPWPPENENSAPHPKHDPCRLFKKGDKVRLVPYKGRAPIMFAPKAFGLDEILTVEEKEDNAYNVMINNDSYRQTFQACFLELVTPVEELEPYSVRHNDAHAAYSIYGPYGLSAVNYFYGDRYPYSKHSAEAAALAECDRLNAAYRKEQENA